MKPLPDKIVDFHVHLFPDRLFDAIRDYFFKVYNWDVVHRLYHRECIEYLRKRDVSHIVFSNYAHKPDVACELNRWNIEVLEENPDVFCFAAFHPEDKDGIRMAADLLDHPRILGFKLQLLVQPFFPDDERFFPLYEMVIEKNKRLLFHVGTGPVGNPYVGIGPFRRLMNRYPNLPANIAHMGGVGVSGIL